MTEPTDSPITVGGLTLEQRLYPAMSAKPDALPATTGSLAPAPALSEGQQAYEATASRTQDIAEQTYPADGSPPADGNYAPYISAPFDDLERHLREVKDLDSLKILAQGKNQVIEALKEFGVGAPGAREMARVFGHYNSKPLTDAELARQNVECRRQLELKWGLAYQRNLGFAAQAYGKAIARMPWIKEQGELGAFSDPAVIIHFAAIGRRIARMARQAKKP